MQKLPSIYSINIFNNLLKNYNQYISFCDPEDDYDNLNKCNLSQRTIINCLKAIVFNIEVNVLYPKLKTDLLNLKTNNPNVQVDYILNNENIINFDDFCLNSTKNNLDTNKYNYVLEYKKIIQKYKDKIKGLNKLVKEEKQSNQCIGTIGGKYHKTPNVNTDMLNDFETVVYHLINDIDLINVKSLTLLDLNNIYFINPDINIKLENQTGQYYVNTLNLKNQYLNIRQTIIKINDIQLIKILNDYVQSYGIQHNQKIFGDKSLSWFSRTFHKIFNCSFTDYKYYLNKR